MTVYSHLVLLTEKIRQEVESDKPSSSMMVVPLIDSFNYADTRIRLIIATVNKDWLGNLSWENCYLVDC